MMNHLYTTYSVGSYATPQYLAAHRRFEHGGGLFGDYNGRDTNRGLDDLAMALQNDLSQIKSDVAQVKRCVNQTTPGARLCLTG